MPEDPSLPTVVTKAYDVLLWCVNHVGKFPRSHRFVLGERIETAMLETVLLLVEASYVGVIRQGRGGQLLCIPRRRVTDTSLRKGRQSGWDFFLCCRDVPVGRLSWMAGRQTMPVTMPKTISSPDTNAEDDEEGSNACFYCRDVPLGRL